MALSQAGPRARQIAAVGVTTFWHSMWELIGAVALSLHYIRGRTLAQLTLPEQD